MSKNLTVDGNNYTGVQKIEALDSDTNQYVSFVDTSDADATDGDILQGKTAYVNGVKITGTGTGGEVDEDAGCLFIDYDGTELYKYSVDEALALSALPGNPTHSGLVAQGWNWTLQEIQDYLTSYPEAMVVVGQQYITDDGATRLHIHLENGRLSPTLRLTFVTQSTTATIDWGDGSPPIHATYMSSGWSGSHTYSQAGNYTISVKVTNGSIYIPGFNTSPAARSNLFSNATWYNTALVGVNIGSSTTFQLAAFSPMYAMKYITIPNGTLTISYGGTFRYDYNLVSITIPRSWISYSGYEFDQCYGLQLVSLPGNLNTTIPSSLFTYCRSLKYTTIPQGVTTISEYVFRENYALRCINIPSSVTSIGRSAFYMDHSLKSVYLPDSVTSVGVQAFANCSSMLSCRWTSNVTTIQSNTFEYCSSLLEITNTSNVSSIGPSGFRNCNSLTSIDLSSVTSYEMSCLQNTLLSEIVMSQNTVFVSSDSFASMTNLSKITLDGNGVTTAPNLQGNNSLKSFVIKGTYTTMPQLSGAYGITKIEIPNTITAFTDNQFQNCYALQEVNIPSGITIIPQACFYRCYSLFGVDLPPSISSISVQAFYQCYAGYIKFNSTTPPTLHSNAFTDLTSTCLIIVPYEYYASYRGATYYPNPSTYTYLGFATYTSGDTLPTTDTTGTYSATWYATLEDARNQTNPITVGNDNEIYCRYAPIT